MLRNRTYSKRASVSDGGIQAYGTLDGLYLSQDYGVTWSKIYSNAVKSVKFTTNSILIVTANGLFQSYDNGLNWIEIITNTAIFSLHVSSNGNNICAVASKNCYSSIDEGANFLSYEDSNLADAFCLNNCSVLYASLSDLTIDIDDNTKVNALSTNNRRVQMIATNANEQYILVCDYNLVYMSSDYGNSFTKLTGYYGHWIHEPAISSDGRYITITYGYGTMTQNDVFVSDDFGQTWSRKYDNANNIKGYFRGAAMSSSGKFQLAATNIKTIIKSNDFGVTWSSMPITANSTCVAIK